MTDDSKLLELLDSQEYSKSKISKRSSEITLSEEQFNPGQNNCKKASWIEWDIKNGNFLFNLKLLHGWQSL